MSVHVSPPFPNHAAGTEPTESSVAFDAKAQDHPAFAAGWSGRIATARCRQPIDDMLWVRLRHMGVAVVLSAIDSEPPSERGPPWESNEPPLQTIHFPMDLGAPFPSLRPLLGLDRDVSSERLASAVEDPVIMRISRALEAAERSEDRFAGLYADALRLAVVTRIVSLRGHAASVPPGVHPPRCLRPNSGLVKWRLKRVTEFVDAQLHQPITLADMAAAAGLSRMHFAAQFRMATGLRAHEYLLKRRIESAQRLLMETREPLAQIALSVGFKTQAHFTTVFRRFVGDTPYQWRCARMA
jgi:AraC family transcriptional regulator